jgi:hypothetical protein
VRTLSGSIGGGARAGGGVSVCPRRVGRRPAAGTQISTRCSTNAGQRVEGEASLGRVGGVGVEGRRRFRSGARYRGGPALPRSRTSARERNRCERGEKGWLGTRPQGL